MSKTDTASNDGVNLTKNAGQISTVLQKKLSAEAEGDTARIVPDKDILKEVIDSFPDGSSIPTIEEIKRVQAFAQDYTAGGVHAVGVLGQSFLNKHKKVQNVHMEKLPFGKDSLRVNMAREKQVSAPGGKSTTHNHYLEAKWTSGSAGASGAQVKRIREHFTSAAAAAAAAD